MEQTVNYTSAHVRALFEGLREKIRRETSREAGASVARQPELPGIKSPAAWNPVQALNSPLQQSLEADGQEDPHFHSASERAFTGLAGLIAKNAAARARRLSGMVRPACRKLNLHQIHSNRKRHAAA